MGLLKSPLSHYIVDIRGKFTSGDSEQNAHVSSLTNAFLAI